jgi:hypothetical protein
MIACTGADSAIMDVALGVKRRMLVLFSPEFNGSDTQIEQLAHTTGLLPYDLRTRLKPGTWGVLKVLANVGEAESLVAQLNSIGVNAVVVDYAVGQDPKRKVAYLSAMELRTGGMLLRLSQREMFVPFGALVAIVRGEVHLGRSQRGNVLGASSGQVRPTPPPGLWSAGSIRPEPVSIGDGRNPSVTDVFAAADLHFATVHWIARIDARTFEFPVNISPQSNALERLDVLVDWLAVQAQVRVDRHLRISSLGSHTEGARGVSNAPNGSGSRRSPPHRCDEYFDAYSRLVAEAERCRRGPIH